MYALLTSSGLYTDMNEFMNARITNVKFEKSNINPATSDNMMYYMVLYLLSLIGMGILIFKLKENKI